ncbi:MAG TPA: helix-turn-helix domain-containing protein [Paracoccaceae bacterium]|nr:helix-turn-helix domain-containing protein [Paracoccaceae bacterium]HMO70182.1 helix-turn-helix domain-containing protein [Paracoccaceae bacterium]
MAGHAPPALPDRQDAILDAAFHAFATYGYRRTTIEDIAHGAGLSRTAVYLHFRSKEDVFRSLSERYFETCLGDMEAALSAPGPAEEVLRAAFAAKDGKFMDVVLGTPHGRELLDAGFAVSADLAQTAEARMARALADWIEGRGGTAALGDPEAAAATVIAALKGLKTSAASLADYRAGQAVLARMLARALA